MPRRAESRARDARQESGGGRRSCASRSSAPVPAVSAWGSASAARASSASRSSRRPSGVGGTWYHNRYPGCACDVPSHLYSFSFEIKRDWSRPYAPQPEILAYLEHCAEKYGLLPHCRFGDAVRRAALGRGGGALDARARLGPHASTPTSSSARSACSTRSRRPTSRASTPSPARASTPRAGTGITISPARRVGVIGSAASAVQLVPEIVKQAASRPPVPAHGELGGAEAGRPLHREAARALPQRSRVRAGGAREDLRLVRRPGLFAQVRSRHGGRLPRQHGGRARIPRCARGCCPTIPGAASARSSPTTTTRPSTGRTSSSSPTRSSASRRRGRHRATAASAASTR